MSRWQLIATVGVVYALTLLALAPSSLVDASLAQASGDRLRLTEARGTLWSGSGELELRGANRRGAIAKSIAWRIRPSYLLRGALRYEIALDRTPQYFPVTIAFGRIEVTNADVGLPAVALGLAIPKLAALELSGDMQLHVARFTAARGSILGNATLQWRGAGSAFTPISPLGDYELRLLGDGNTVNATLHTLQGPLQLDGRGSWSSGRNPVFDGSARVPPQDMQQLAPLLRLISIERGGGRFELQLR